MIEVLGMVLRFGEFRYFVIISTIHDIGAFAAARAFLVHLKPCGKIGDDLAAFGAD
jgi:hypothetical protein